MLQTNILKCNCDTKYRYVHEFSGGLPQTRINIFEVNYFKCWHNGKLYMNGQVNFTMKTLHTAQMPISQVLLQFPDHLFQHPYEETINMSCFEDWSWSR